MDLKKIKETAKTKIEDAKAFYKLHRNTVNASAAAFVGALVSAIIITKKSGTDSIDIDEQPVKNESYDWRKDWEDGEVEYKGERIKGSWLQVDDGRIFFAENEDGNLP